jgi:hypothetical protein
MFVSDDTRAESEGLRLNREIAMAVVHDTRPAPHVPTN